MAVVGMWEGVWYSPALRGACGAPSIELAGRLLGLAGVLWPGGQCSPEHDYRPQGRSIHGEVAGASSRVSRWEGLWKISGGGREIWIFTP